MGEVVLRHHLAQLGRDDVTVESAGVSSEESGNPIDRRAQRVLADAGYDVPRRRAHRATPAELREADLVLAMTVGHARRLRSMMAEAGADPAKVHLWREFDPSSGLTVAEGGVFGPGGVLGDDDAAGARAGKRGSISSQLYTSNGEYDVPDPWYGGPEDFDLTLETVEAATPHIVTWLLDN